MKYSIEIPADLVRALRRQMGEDVEGLTDRGVVIAWLRQQAGPVMKRYRRGLIGLPTEVEAARDAAQKAVVAEIEARKAAENEGDALAESDVEAIV